LIKSLHHVDIIIPKGSEEFAREFYCKLLGFLEIAKPDILNSNGGLWLQLDNCQLHLSIEKKEGYNPRNTKAHIAYQVFDIQKLEKLLLKNKYIVKKQTQIPGMTRIESEDPFGDRIEFLEVLA